MKLFGGLLRKKPVKERLPERVLVEDVVPQLPKNVRIEEPLPCLRKLGSRRDRREKSLEYPRTRAGRRMKEKLARRRMRKRRQIKRRTGS